MKRKIMMACAAMLVGMMLMGADGCNSGPAVPVSSSGVSKTTVKIPTGSDGLTTEQRNVRERLVMDNKPGSVKHLYIVSAYSGQVLVYSTVRGKVTSSGKRLTPTSISGRYDGTSYWNGISVDIGGQNYQTSEVLQDDGTYGSSIEYLYWWDTKGVYHQQYVQGGMMVHISDQPLVVKNIVINMELTNAPAAEE